MTRFRSTPRVCLSGLLAASLLMAALASAGADVKKPVPAGKPAPAPAPPAASPADAPVIERAEQLREAAKNLEKALAAKKKGQKSLAEQLFSFAELIVGPEAVADLAGLFREGAPPRVTTPTVKVDPAQTAQPAAVGSSEDDEPEKKPAKGSLTGTVQIDGKTEGAIAVITLTPVSGKAKKRVPKQRVIEQRGRQFAPRVMAVPVGSTVSFPNFDPMFHNVFSSSDTKPFDLGLYKGGEAREIQVDREGVIRLGCNLHANMSAYIVVVAAPHYKVADSSGKFAFKSLAPGKYTMKVYSEKSKAPLTQEVVVKAGPNTVEAGVKSDADKGPLPDKFGVSRGKSS